MQTHKQSTEIEIIACEICLKEIPPPVAHTTEVDDYVMHFCGLECYDQWHKEAADKK